MLDACEEVDVVEVCSDVVVAGEFLPIRIGILETFDSRIYLVEDSELVFDYMKNRYQRTDRGSGECKHWGRDLLLLGLIEER